MFISTNHIPPQLFKNFSQRAEKELIAGILKHPELTGKYIQRRLSCYPFIGLVSQGQVITELLMKLWGQEFNELIKTVKNFESFLGGIRKRGHFIHQFEVFILGLNIISRIEELTKLAGKDYPFNNPASVFRRWLMTSTVHDFGYPLEAANDLSKEIAVLYETMGFTKTADTFKSLSGQPITSLDAISNLVLIAEDLTVDKEINLSDYVMTSIDTELRLSSEKSKKLKDDLKNHANHGYVSALLLSQYMLKSLHKKYKSWNATQASTSYLSLSHCLSAIALHALEVKIHKSYIKKINFDENPMTYLLHLIDNVQEWSRGTSENFEKYPSYHLISFSTEKNLMKLGYFLQHDTWTPKMVADTKKFLKKKKDRIQMPIPPKIPIGLNILIEYDANCGDDKFESIDIKL